MMIKLHDIANIFDKALQLVQEKMSTQSMQSRLVVSCLPKELCKGKCWKFDNVGHNAN